MTSIDYVVNGAILGDMKSRPSSNFGHELRRLRERPIVEMSQQDLAEELGYTNSAFISRIETGKVHPPREFVDRLESIEGLKLTRDEADNLRELLGEAPRGRNQFSPNRSSRVLPFQMAYLVPRVLQQWDVDRREKEILARFLATHMKGIARSSFLSIILDSGTMAANIADALVAQRPKEGLWRIYTGNLLVAMGLIGAIPVYLLGGQVDAEFGASLSAEAADRLIERIDILKRKATEAEISYPPLGVLSCLAFTSSEGPLSRLYESEDVPEAERILSPHIQWKAALMANLPWLLVPLTYQKLDRPRKRAWDIAGPIKCDGTNQWIKRIQRGSVEGGPITQIFLTLPEPGTDPRLREKLSWTLRVAYDLINSGPKETRFNVSTELMLPPANKQGGNAITLIDEGTLDSIPTEQLVRFFVQEGLGEA